MSPPGRPKGESLSALREGYPMSVQAWVAAGVAALGALVLAAAARLPSQAGYTGVGPDFVPLLVGVMLLVCGGLLLRQALRGGWRDTEPPPGSLQGCWGALAWVSAGIIANAVLITSIGFILSCTLCYVLAVRGMRTAQGVARQRPAAWVAVWLADIGTGAALTTPVYLLFTQLLAINLPGLTSTGWL